MREGAKHLQHEPALDKAEAHGMEHWGLSTSWGCPCPQHEPAGAQRHQESSLPKKSVSVLHMGLAVSVKEALESF